MLAVAGLCLRPRVASGPDEVLFALTRRPDPALYSQSIGSDYMSKPGLKKAGDTVDKRHKCMNSRHFAFLRGHSARAQAFHSVGTKPGHATLMAG